MYIFNVGEFKQDCGLMVSDFQVKPYVLECFYNIITWNYEEMLLASICKCVGIRCLSS